MQEPLFRTPQRVAANTNIKHKITQLQKRSSLKFSELTSKVRRPSQPRKTVQRLQAISMQRNMSQEPQVQSYSVVFTNSAPQKREKRKIQTTNCDQIEETRHSSIRLIKGFYPSDINNTKQILTSILSGMQHKIVAEKAMNVMGLQVIPFNKLIEQQTVTTQQTIRQDREASKSFSEDYNKKQKQESIKKVKPQLNNASPVKQVGLQSSTQIPNTNFKFSLTEYSQLSREQLFQTKLQNYQHFLFLVSAQSGFYTLPSEAIDLKFRLGRGNNSPLIKEAFKLRWWWNCSPYWQDQECNFIWTQIKVQEYMDTQPLSSYVLNTKHDKRKMPSISVKHSEPTLRLMRDDSEFKQVERSQKTYQKLANQKQLTILKATPEIKIHNHIEKNYHLGNKKALYHNLKRYYEITKQDLHAVIPTTFHIQKGARDRVYLQFLEHYKKLPKDSTWIVKPGEFTNRGTGITVCQSLSEINRIITKKQVHPNGKNFTYLIQRYIEKPFLYNKRKFDIRCYFLITQFNNVMRAYWYEDGYIRTSSEEFDLDDPANLYVHLTNDAIQKHADTYGKYENGNKLSFTEFQRYLDNQPKKFNFFKDLYPQLIEITTISIKSVYCKLAPHKKDYNFEIFGLDFMIDSNFKPYLIEINTNPCLETSSPVLQRIIPQMVENAIRLSVDTVVPPPDSTAWPPCKKHLIFYDNLLENNKFQLIFDERDDAESLIKLYGGLLLQDEIDEMDEEEEEFPDSDADHCD